MTDLTEDDKKYITDNKLNINHLTKLGLTVVQLGIDHISDNVGEDIPRDPRIDSILSELKDLQIKLGGSSKKGQITEDIIKENLIKHFPHAEIVDSRYSAGAGDLIIHINGFVFMIEIKNYKCNVPSKEIKKFMTNLVDNKYHSGLLVSCSSGIAGCKSSMKYNIVDKSISLQLPNAGMDGIAIVWGIRFCLQVLEVLKELSSSDTELFISHVKTKMALLNSVLDDNQKLKSIVKRMRINVIATVDNSVLAINHSIDQNDRKLQNIIGSFTDFIETGVLETDISILRSTKTPLHEMTMSTLMEMAKDKKIKGRSKMKKNELVEALK